VRAAMERAGVDWTDRTLVTTGPSGNLRSLAETHGLPALDVPAGVPGRFSALSTVALPVAALAGCDLDALVAGARTAADGLSGSLFETPAYAYGATCYALERRGARVNAMMPYAESLERFAEWFAQLWAESLGKDALGQTPARALGATDQHSQLQLYRAGPRDKLVTLVRPRERPTVSIPDTDLDGLTHLGGEDLGGVLDAEFAATEASLAATDCPNVRVELDRVDARSVGGLLYGMEAACVLYGELAGVETFTQPAVEWGKRAARGLLGAAETAEADAVGEKRELRVE
jgi:glucose-6-phosphate isomerase